MSKKQSTLFAGGGVTVDPGDFDFVVDGQFAGILFTVFDMTGTDISGAVTELFDDGFAVAYDAQTVNFTVGAEAKGSLSGATGIIVKDTDGGATGTLILKKVIGHFRDNEPLVDDDGTPGAAVVNGVPVRQVVTGADWVTIVARTGAGSDNYQFLNPLIPTGDGDRGRVLPRRFRLTQTFNTITTASYAIDLIQSEV